LEMKRLFDTVLAAQEEAIASVRDAADGQTIHSEVLRRFEQAGYKTGLVNGRMQGFFHGTGHGVGIDIHEMPRISKSGSRLQTGHVVTVEPGLYYPGIGAARIEDVVLVTDDGCRNLTNFPKVLAIDYRTRCAWPSQFVGTIPNWTPRLTTRPTDSRSPGE